MSAASVRAERLAARVAEREIDLLLVSDLVNVRYLTSFACTNGFCLVGPKLRCFLTDFRYIERARQEIDGWDIEQLGREPLEKLVEVVRAAGAARLGFDDANVSVRQHARLAELAGDAIELVAAAGLVEALRAVKDESELEAIRAAADLADEVYHWLDSDHGLRGHSERDVARAIERRALELGGAVSFPPIVAAADAGALPHAEPGDVEIAADTLVVVDLGCQLDGYCSDCTRTYATGRLDDEATKIYELVLAAQGAALEAAVAGAGCEAVDAAARRLIDGAGHKRHFGHGTGHGVGLEVHEAPRLGPGAEGTLERGNVVTIEPGVYLPGRFGVRIEDLVVVTDDGAQILTATPKELTVVT